MHVSAHIIPKNAGDFARGDFVVTQVEFDGTAEQRAHRAERFAGDLAQFVPGQVYVFDPRRFGQGRRDRLPANVFYVVPG